MPPSPVDCEEEEEEEEAAVSSPNSTVSTVSGKRSEPETNNGEDLDGDEEDAETSRKKLRLTKDQSAVLEDSFKEHNTLNPVSPKPDPTRPVLFPKFCRHPNRKFMGVFW